MKGPRSGLLYSVKADSGPWILPRLKCPHQKFPFQEAIHMISIRVGDFRTTLIYVTRILRSKNAQKVVQYVDKLNEARYRAADL